MNYYSAALGAAFNEAYLLGFVRDNEMSRRCYGRALARQRADGSFGFSAGDYGFLRDERSYPRYQAMTLFLMLGAGSTEEGFA